jgi:GT2 family glycosyltransferase
MKDSNEVMVVVVNWELPRQTIACLHSLQASTIDRLQLLVVDNGSQDDSVAQIRTEVEDVELLVLPSNTGFVGGYNAGIERALASEATHIFLLNNDTTVEPTTLQRLLDSPWDIAVPKILLMDRPGIIWSAGARWRRFPPSVVMNGYLKPDDGRYDQEQSLKYATACALMIRRQVLEVVGGFDDDFENYTEDYDFFYRVGQKGYSAGYVPEARIYHEVSASLGPDSLQKWWYMGRNTVLFYRKGDRLPAWMLWSHIVWVLTRESLKGNVKVLPAFWRGVLSGLTYVRTSSQELVDPEKKV